MVEIGFSLESALSPQQVVDAATDFSPRRPKVWSGIDPTRYQVHRLGVTSADVTEGGAELGGIWARERYDWSTPGLVTAEVQESNVFRRGSRWELRVSRVDNGRSRVEWRSLRQPRGPKGWVLVTMLKLAGRRHLSRYLRHTLAVLETEPR